ncbi:hypothetical protein [Streptomyces sp. 1222.5]|uniref:hypothetical protein n=1 Tax=Streptomyces sp. 1222.5 TaxID=1881026 RepID=UPI003D746A42
MVNQTLTTIYGELKPEQISLDKQRAINSLQRLTQPFQQQVVSVDNLLRDLQNYRARINETAGRMQQQVLELTAQIAGIQAEVNAAAADVQRHADAQLACDILAFFTFGLSKAIGEAISYAETGMSSEEYLAQSQAKLAAKSDELNRANWSLRTSDVLVGTLSNTADNVQAVSNLVTTVSSDLSRSAQLTEMEAGPISVWVKALENKMIFMRDSLA